MSEEQQFVALGFIPTEDYHKNRKFGDKGQALYIKGFVKRHTHVSYCYIEGSQDPDTLEYSLRLDNMAHLKTDETVSERMVIAFRQEREAQHLDDLVESFKTERGVPESVQIGVRASYEPTGLSIKGIEVTAKYEPTSLSIKGMDLASIYAEFEQALIGLGFIKSSIRDKPTKVIYGPDVGLM